MRLRGHSYSIGNYPQTTKIRMLMYALHEAVMHVNSFLIKRSSATTYWWKHRIVVCYCIMVSVQERPARPLRWLNRYWRRKRSLWCCLRLWNPTIAASFVSVATLSICMTNTGDNNPWRQRHARPQRSLVCRMASWTETEPSSRPCRIKRRTLISFPRPHKIPLRNRLKTSLTNDSPLFATTACPLRTLASMCLRTEAIPMRTV